MTSRKLITLLDGLPDESWYKTAARLLLQKMEEDEERAHKAEVRSLIHAQLYGQMLGG